MAQDEADAVIPGIPSNKDEVKALLEKAAECLFVNQPDLSSFTSETSETEWNLAPHYANEVKSLLSGYSLDQDVIKPSHGNKRPDIIFHRRDTEDNFLVIEMKRNGAQKEICCDIRKIKNHWFQGELKYRFGASVNLKSDKTFEIEVLENDWRRQ